SSSATAACRSGPLRGTTAPSSTATRRLKRPLAYAATLPIRTARGTWQQRESQRPAEAILPKAEEPCTRATKRLRRRCPEAQLTTQETLWLPHPDRTARRTLRGVALGVLIHPSARAWL